MHRTSHFTLVVIALLLMVGLAGIQPVEPVQAALPTDLFFSEYVEGTDGVTQVNRAIEIYNGTGSPVDLSGYRLELYSNGVTTATATVNLSGTLATGDVFVVAHPLANPVFLTVADLTSATVINFDGDDAFALRKISTELFVDVIGQIGYRPPSGYWGSNPVQTQNRTLIRKVDICTGDPDGSNAFNPASEWDGFANDTYAYLGLHTSSCAPTVVSLNPTTVNENEVVGRTVGTFSATDGDTGKTYTYSLIDGVSYPDNALFTIQGDLLKTAVVFNHEDDDIKQIKVRATDSTGLYVDKVFSIGILDINEYPVLAPIGPKSLKNTATLTFTATATDPDEGNTLTWSLGSGAPTWASIIPTTGQVTLSPSSSALGNYPVEICVSDSVYQDCETITVTLTDGVAPVVVSGVAYGVAPYTNITADSTLTFTVPQGYEVSTIKFTMDEAVTVEAGTQVSLAGVPYGDIAVDSTGLIVTVTPLDGNEVAAQLGTFNFSIPAGSIKDLAGNALTTLSASLVVTDQTAPVMEAVTPAEGVVTLDADETFVLTVDAFDLNLYSLEVDHTFEATLPEFTVYASASNPWGSEEAQAGFDAYGMTVAYDETLQKWTIDFGEVVTDTFIPDGVDFFIVLHDEADNKWGSMDSTNPDNTFEYTFVVTNTLEPEITSAVTYVYPDPTPYDYVGDIAFDDPNNIFTATYSPAEFLAEGAMNDLARYLGALYRQDGSTVIKITFNGVEYTWDETSMLKGSRWEDASGTTLVNRLVAYYFSTSYDPALGLPITVRDGWHTSDVTFRLLITNTLDDEIESAPSYVYSDYTYVGTRVFDDTTNFYTVTYDDVEFNPNAMYDLARYLGALHRQDAATVTSIVYNGVTYTWNPTGTLHGSNWVDGSGNTLVSAVVAGIGSYDPAVGLVFTVADGVHTENVTFKFVILDTTAPVVSQIQALSSTDGNITAVGTTLTVVEGYTVDTIEITLSEPIVVAAGTVVTMDGVGAYGTILASGSKLIVTPYPGNETAVNVGTFTFSVPAGSIADPSGNPLGDISLTLVVQDASFFVTQDFGPFDQVTYPGWVNLGWQYTESFDTTTIASIEIGMKDAAGNLIVKYTASGDQIIYQRNNGYINPDTKQSSLPFYQYLTSGEPIPEGPDLDATVIKGPAFTAWAPASGYICVVDTEGTEDCKTVTYSGDLPLVVGTLTAQDFGYYTTSTAVGDVIGYSAGFSLDVKFTDATIVVELYSGDTLLQTNTSVDGMFDHLNGISGPFDVFGTFDYVTDGYWTNARGAEFGEILIPTKVVATATLASGKVVTAENTLLTSTLDNSLPMVQGQTTLTGNVTPDGILATFPLSIPTAVVNEPYKINSQITLGAPLPAGSLVSVTRDGVALLTNATLSGTGPWWITDLLGYPLSASAEFDANYGGSTELYMITITGNIQPINTTLTLNSIISRDGFVDEKVVLAEETFALVVSDVVPPVVTISGAMDGTTAMDGDLATGFILPTTNNPAINHSLQIVATSSEPLADNYFGLNLTDATEEQIAALEAYYATKSEPYKAYLLDALDGTNPFVYIDGGSLTLVDAAQHDLDDNDVPMVVPDDFPLGTYTVSGNVADGSGNTTPVTLILLVTGDRVAPEVVSGVAIGATGFDPVTAGTGLTFTVPQGYRVHHIEITMNEAVEIVAPGIVYFEGNPYGTMSASGNVVTITPDAGNEVAGIPGTFDFTIDAGSIKDLAGNNLTTLTATMVVEPSTIFGMTDFGMWGEAWPGAYNVGWQYVPLFDTTTIANIEVGMLDADRKSIVTYTAEGDQIVWQLANGWIPTPPANLSSAPFYRVYNGNPIVEGTDSDWTVIFGESFGGWSPKWGYVRVTDIYGTVVYHEREYTGTFGDLTAPVVSSATAIGVDPYGDITADNLTFTVPQGYTVEKIDFTMSEPVTVVAGTEVTLAGVPYGLVSVSADGVTITVTPYPGNTIANLLGAFTFVVPEGKIFDISGNPLGTLSAAMIVTNIAPVAVDDAYSMIEDGVLTIAVRGVLINDTDFDPAILTAVKVTDPANGALALNADGSFTYTPDAEFNGTDTFTYMANDGYDNSNIATVTITVTAVNDAPVAVNDTYRTTFETPATITAPGVLGNDTDVDRDSLTAALVTGVNNGTLVLNADGSFTYTPNTGFSGVDTFTYKANDGTLDSGIATVTITVTTYVNTPPVAVDDTYETDQDVQLVVPAPGVLLNDYDIDNDILTATLKTNVTNGTLVLLENGSFTYTPNAGFCGVDSFVYTLVSYPRINADGWTADATATITVYCDPIISSDNLDGPFYVGTMQEFQVTLTNLEYGHEFTNVLARFRLENITLTDIASFQYLETSVDPDVWLPLPLAQDGTDVIGDFGPAEGFQMAAPYSATSQFKVNFKTGGTYPASIVLYDVAADPDVELDSYAADVLVVDMVSPVVDITGATVDGEAMGGDLATGYILPTANVPAVDHLLQINATVDEPLATKYNGLYFVEGESTVTAAQLKAYYDARGVPSEPLDFLGYLKGAADGINPFVFIKEDGLSLSLVDAAKHALQGTDVDMTVPDDFPLGTYVVRGVVEDADGNETTVTLILIVTGDRVAPVVTIDGATVGGDPMGGDLATGYILPTTNVPAVDHLLQIDASVDEPLATKYNGLYFVEAESTVTAAQLKAYYDARGVPSEPLDFLGYLKGAADGINPFVFIKEEGLSLSLVDAAKHALQSEDVDMTVPDDFPLGKYVVRGVVADADGNETTVTLILIVTGDRVEPVVDITAATADGVAMGGDLATGYILPTTNDPAVDHYLQITATVDAPLADVYSGLYFVEAESTVSTAELQAYYAARGLPTPYLEYLNGAAAGTNPFVFIKEDALSLSLVDAAKHTLQGADVDMTVPDDFPLGKYVVRGILADEAGNETTVTLILIVTGDRVEPTITSITAFGADEFADVVAVGTTLTVDQGYTVDHTEIVVNEPVTVAAGTVVTLAGQPYGTITVDATGLILTITPYPGNEIANLVGSFVFSVPAGSITDLAGNALETLSLTLVVNNVAPVAVADAYTVAEDGVLTVAARGVLTNDTDFDPAILTAVKVTDPANGILVLNADGSFTYTPDADFHGTDTFTYKANDGLADSNIATVTITVTSVLDAPTVSSTNLPGPYLVGLEREFQVTLTNPSNGDVFTNVLARFRLEGVTLADIASFQYLETSGEPDVWLPLPLSQDGTGVIGDFGPAAGFQMAAPYSATSQFKVTFNTAGTYPATIVLYDLTADPDLALDSYAADVLVVANFAVTDAVLTSSVDQATWTNLPGNFTDGFMMYLDPSVEWYYLDADTITANNTLADGLYPFYLAPDTTTPIFYVRVVGTDYMLVDAFLLERDGIELPLRINGDFVPGTYTYTGELEDIYGSSAQISIEITFIDALAWLQANTMLSSVSGMVDDLKATFPAEIPAVIVAEDYVIDSRMTLAAPLPAGSTVTVFKDGVEILTDITLSGTGPFWFTELFTPDVARAAFDANYGGKIENYSIVVTGPGGNVLDFETTVFIESVISKDDFVTETVLDDITLGVLIPADELAALEWLQANTVLSSVSMMVDDLTATFPLSIPPVIVAEDYLIDSRMTLSAPLPTGSTVTVFKGGVEILTDITLSGIGPFWFTELFTPDVARAAFDANYGGKVETYSIVVTGPAGLSADFDTTVFIESVISKDEFVTETVLDDITLGIHLDDAVAPVIESGVAKSASHGDVMLVDGAFTVNQGFVVDTIEITMDEDVLVDLGTIVTMVGYGDYGTITANVDGVITITPYPGYGTAALIGTFTFTVPDGSITDLRGNEFTGSILLNVLNVAPVAMDDAYTTDEDVALTVPARGVLVNDTDFDPAILTTVWVSDPANGTLVLNADGSFTYTPDADFHGTDTFTYKATDGLADSNVATVTITVTSVNDSPVLGLIADATIPELVEFSFTATATDADLPAQLLTFSLVGAPEGAAIDAAGVFTWTPSELQGAGVYTFTVKVCDDATPALCDEQDVTLTVTEVNVAPVLGTIEDATIPELVEFSFTATATDADLPAQLLTFSLVGAPDGAAIDAAGVFTWTPSELQGAGVYTFTVKVCDDATPALCDEQDVTLTVTEVNAAPVAQNLSATTAEETPVDVTLMATDAENNPLTYAIVAQPGFGTVTLDGTTATYTPALDFVGEDSFTYLANDGLVDSNVATVTITVTPVNDAPVAVDDDYTMAEKETLTIGAPGVLANDNDVDGDTLTAILVDTVSNGTLTLNADGSFTYTPDEYFNGTDSFTYKANDGVEDSELAIVTITVTPVNDWPIANDDFYEVVTGTELIKDAAEGVLANDVLLDPDEEVSIQILEEPQHGTLSMNDDGSFTYTPDAGFMGTDTFRYLVLSVRAINAEWSDDAVVTIVVNPYMRLFLPIIWR